jgi:hypothetical protein
MISDAAILLALPASDPARSEGVVRSPRSSVLKLMGALSLETSLSPKIGGDCGDGKNELMKKKTHI